MSNSQETVLERQENELMVLEAVYGDSIFDVRKRDVWKASSYCC